VCLPFHAETITPTADERAELEQMTQSRTQPSGDVFREPDPAAPRPGEGRGEIVPVMESSSKLAVPPTE
jgi:hypothetical protein